MRSRPRCRGCAGAFALAFLFEGEDDLLIGARTRLAAGGRLRRRRDVSRLRRHRAGAVHRLDQLSRRRRLGRGHARQASKIHDAAGAPVKRAVLKSNASSFLVDKGNHRHFMAKEIHEQPEVVGHTLAHYLDMAGERVSCCRTSCRSTSTNARAHVDLGLRHGVLCRAWSANTGSSGSRACRSKSISRRNSATASAPLDDGDLALFVSQSGETADTLAALRYAKEQRAARAVDRQRADVHDRARKRVVMPTLAGPEIGVASTKAFTCQLGGAGLPRDRVPAARAACVSEPTRSIWCAR